MLWQTKAFAWGFCLSRWRTDYQEVSLTARLEKRRRKKERGKREGKSWWLRIVLVSRAWGCGKIVASFYQDSSSRPTGGRWWFTAAWAMLSTSGALHYWAWETARCPNAHRVRDGRRRVIAGGQARSGSPEGLRGDVKSREKESPPTVTPPSMDRSEDTRPPGSSTLWPRAIRSLVDFVPIIMAKVAQHQKRISSHYIAKFYSLVSRAFLMTVIEYNWNQIRINEKYIRFGC